MIEKYINVRNSLRNLTDNQFEQILPQLSQQLYDKGFIYIEYSDIEIKKDFQSLYKKKIDKNNISATNTTGMKIIKHTMKNFYHVKNFKNKCIKDLWTIENLEKALRFNRKYHSTPYISEIIRSIAFTNGLGCITIYRPFMAKTIMHYFNIKSVLDISVGWGGRMLGCKSFDKNLYYVGIEPNTETFHNLSKIKKDLELTNVELYNEPAEHCLPHINQKFDMALTSPPYYNLEIYSDEQTQSHHYGSYNEWKSKFLIPVIENVLSKVKYSAWSIKNFKTDKEYNLYDDVVEIHKKNNWKQLDIQFSMNNSKRPGVKKENEKTKEITYIFVKNDFNQL
jgi:hypothetical protein